MTETRGTPPRTALWRSIADTLGAEIAAGHWRPGDRLPTEAQLSARFSVNRHTLRRALASLAEAGLVRTRRGSGVFVAARAVADYPLGRRVRFHQNLEAAGRVPSRRIDQVVTRRADAGEAEALALAPGAEVHVVEGVSLADGEPLAVFRAVFPAARFPNLPKVVGEVDSITRALARMGVEDYTRASTRMLAETAPAVLAARLELREGAAILKTVAVNVDAEGRPVEYGTTWFAGERVVLSVTPEAGAG
ncbi:phosphonate metabolism transcriptional regulator PhnF [Frigidibacter sp. ROC022]|uniref:phosphonate metabolism transcriptional regulator PhnF n=1 Tax=Frigidibacter sp. ROC022 TaxID=2971796 RepID=UPI00215A6F54|nr:phosphonate metabolism transcriptional regulator PhnF [Frigidibacter sp. ROC022]MCR8725037.1 phosphonate metabolism transcriptional regulator PhnF [Frigidibacter sp. ROC022]